MNEHHVQHQQQQSRHLYSKIIENGRFHKSHIEILTFLKSNYKYKRRNYTTSSAVLVKQPETVLSTRVDATCSKCTAATFDVASDKTFGCHQHENITQKLKTKSDNFLLKLINLSLVVVLIVANFLYHKLMSSLWSPSALLPPPSNFVQFTTNSCVKKRNITYVSTDDETSLHLEGDKGDANNVEDFNEANGGDFTNENDDSHHDIDGDNFVTISDNNNHDVDGDSDETCCQPNYDKLSTLGCQQQQQQRLPLQHNLNEWLRHQWISLLQLLRRGSASSSLSSSSPLLLSIEIHTQVMSIFMTLFIALALSVRCVEGGACWQKTLYNGKCNEIFSLNITKAECCSTNLEFSYTDRELTSVEYFFATAIGGGMECAPCLESCKNVNCGPNKKCAKRKGRLKCICAPECGAATRRRQKMKLFKGATQPHQHHQHHYHHNSESIFNPVQRNLESAVIFGKSARDIRSLSSEIQNQNLGLTEEDEENLSQRKLFLMQSGEGEVGISGQRKSPMKGGVEITQRKMLLIVEARGQQHEDKPTTRRLQVISNTNNKKHNHHGNKRKKSTKLLEQNHQEEVEETQSMNNRSSSSATALVAAPTSTALQSRSRHTFNANNNNKNTQQQQQQTKNFNAKHRHIHQNFRQQLELEDTPNHHDQQHHGRHHQFRKRKKKLHNKLKQDQLDDVKNADNATTVVATMSGTRTIITTTSSVSTTSTTPVNSSVTEDQRLLNHGSNIATSSSSRLASSSSSSSSSSSTSLSGSGELTNVGVGGSSSSSISHHRTLNSDDMTFDDRIYDKFNMHGFPGQEQQKITPIAKSHSSHHPVCGTDGRTYNTKCQLKKRACRTDNTELVVAYNGHCKTTCNGVKCLNGLTCVEDHYTIPHCIACKIDCPLDDDSDDEIDASRAVCGVDGKTYKSVCDINRMICKIGRSIAVAYPGPCRDDRVTCSDINCGPKRTCLMDLLTHEPRCVSCRYKCSRKRRPSALRYEEGKICGVNSRTYNSWCEMRKDSCVTGFYIDVKSFGECE